MSSSEEPEENEEESSEEEENEEEEEEGSSVEEIIAVEAPKGLKGEMKSLAITFNPADYISSFLSGKIAVKPSATTISPSAPQPSIQPSIQPTGRPVFRQPPVITYKTITPVLKIPDPVKPENAKFITPKFVGERETLTIKIVPPKEITYESETPLNKEIRTLVAKDITGEGNVMAKTNELLYGTK